MAKRKITVTIKRDEIERKIKSGEIAPPKPIPLIDQHKQSTK